MKAFVVRSSQLACPQCGTTTLSPDDLARGWCESCQALTREPAAPLTPWAPDPVAERRALVEAQDTEVLEDMLAHETDPATVALLTLVLRLRARQGDQ